MAVFRCYITAFVQRFFVCVQFIWFCLKIMWQMYVLNMHHISLATQGNCLLYVVGLPQVMVGCNSRKYLEYLTSAVLWVKPLVRVDGRATTRPNSVTVCDCLSQMSLMFQIICWVKGYKHKWDVTKISSGLYRKGHTAVLIGHIHGSLDWDSTTRNQHQGSITFACNSLAPHFVFTVD